MITRRESFFDYVFVCSLSCLLERKTARGGDRTVHCLTKRRIYIRRPFELRSLSKTIETRKLSHCFVCEISLTLSLSLLSSIFLLWWQFFPRSEKSWSSHSLPSKAFIVSFYLWFCLFLNLINPYLLDEGLPSFGMSIWVHPIDKLLNPRWNPFNWMQKLFLSRLLLQLPPTSSYVVMTWLELWSCRLCCTTFFPLIFFRSKLFCSG